MTTPSHANPKGMSVSIWKPTIVYDDPGTPETSNVTYTPRGVRVMDLIAKVDFGFVIEANGGYWSLSLTMKINQNDINDWIEDGLGRHVEVYNSAHVIIWEGLVNSISTAVGGLAVVRGPLNSIMNRATVEYTLSMIVGDEIVTVAGLSTTTTDNADSKLKYGIFEKVLSAPGPVWSEDEADDIMNMHLAAYANPEGDKDFSNQGQSEFSVTLNCLGYIHFFKNYIYNANTAATDNVSVAITNVGDTGKMQKVIEADPNGLFTLTNSDLFINGILEPQWEDQNSDAYTLIQSMVAKGDGADARCLFSVGAGRKITYTQIPTAVEYYQALSDPAQETKKSGNAIVYPWNVLPGEWMKFTDFLIGKVQPAQLDLDQRNIFIEKVAFSTPWGLQLDGGKVNTISQAMARLGAGV